MADSIVRLTVEDSSFNAKIKEAAKAFADFGKNVASAGVEAFGKLAKGITNAKTAFQGFNEVLKANAIMLVATVAIQAGQAIGEMIGNWISGANDAEDAQRSLNDELERSIKLLRQMDDDADFNTKAAKAMGASTSDILQLKKAEAIKRRNAADVALANMPTSAVGSEQYNKLKAESQKYTRLVNKIQDEIDLDLIAQQYKTGEYAAKRAGGGGGRGGSNKTQLSEIQMLQTKIKDLEQEYIKLGTASTEAADKRRTEIRTEIQDNEKRINQINLLNEQAHGKLLGGDVQTSGIVQGNFAGGVPEIGKGLSQLPEQLSPLQQMNSELARMYELLELAPNTDAYLEALQKIADKTKEIKKFKGEDLEDDGKDIAKSWSTASQAISGVSNVLANIDDPAAKVFSIIAQAVATVASGAAQAMAAKDTTASGYAWIGAAAAIAAEMAAIISTIHSSTGFAQGGVVPGNSFSGDNTLIRANAQEVVLTRAMAGNLASQLEGNGLQNLNLSATISGEQIRLALNNNGRRTGRGEYVTTNFT